eukprot:gnl/TRDRNA2_/TRDRNA2_28570_c0_seq1.p1 gnl/TRDRNA2_/TRDRNA2_28570_c0~~gnl/TRDRNA2_/TRDRNA2_28570_c0_seq1.p1  ORF type:complete len:267 (+),score=46.24 gnl/TRDRNA2_/TRDRNA2_28570_c0_seq1:94-801(+)
MDDTSFQDLEEARDRAVAARKKAESAAGQSVSHSTLASLCADYASFNELQTQGTQAVAQADEAAAEAKQAAEEAEELGEPLASAGHFRAVKILQQATDAAEAAQRAAAQALQEMKKLRWRNKGPPPVPDVKFQQGTQIREGATWGSLEKQRLRSQMAAGGTGMMPVHPGMGARSALKQSDGRADLPSGAGRFVLAEASAYAAAPVGMCIAGATLMGLIARQRQGLAVSRDALLSV